MLVQLRVLELPVLLPALELLVLLPAPELLVLLPAPELFDPLSMDRADPLATHNMDPLNGDKTYTVTWGELHMLLMML